MLKQEQTNQKEQGSDLKKECINILYGIIYLVALVVVIRLFHLNRWQIIGLLCSISFISSMYLAIRKRKTLAKALWSFVKSSIFIIIFINLISWLAQFGVWGYLTSIVIITAWLLSSRWERYIIALKRIETLLYGKPLDKELWTSKPKMKRIKWR